MSRISKVKKQITFILLSAFLISYQCNAKLQYGTLIVSKIISVYDGDAFRVNINSMPPILGQNIAIRINGIDAPEIKRKRKYEKDLAIKVRNLLFNAKEIKLTNMQRGKYFRIVANALLLKNSIDQTRAGISV